MVFTQIEVKAINYILGRVIFMQIGIIRSKHLLDEYVLCKKTNFIFSCHCRLNFSFRDAAQLSPLKKTKKQSDWTVLRFGAYSSTSENFAVEKQNHLVVRESQETEGFSLSLLLICCGTTGKSLYFDQFITTSPKDKDCLSLCLLSWHSHQSCILHIVIPAKNRDITVRLIM